MSDVQPSQSGRPYRCSECGRDEGLTAISYGYMIGTLAADGSGLDDYSQAIEDTELCKDTIACPDHFDAPIDKLINGVWHRWRRCDAAGCVAGRVWNRYRGYIDCNACEGVGGLDAPIEDVANVA